MRKPRDFDSELKALTDKARQLRERKLHQLGELVIATGADALPVEQLAGLLLTGIESKDAVAKEAWRKRGATFFQRTAGSGPSGSDGNSGSAEASNRGAPPAGSETRS